MMAEKMTGVSNATDRRPARRGELRGSPDPSARESCREQKGSCRSPGTESKDMMETLNWY